MYSVIQGADAHAVFNGELGAIQNAFQPDVVLKGRSRHTSRILNDIKLTHEVIPFTIVDKTPCVIDTFMEGDAINTPISHHITE